MPAVNATIELEILTCGKCGIQFGVPPWWVKERRTDHAVWNCPNGHSLAFKAESDIELAQRQAREAQAQLNQERHLRLVAEKAREAVLLAKKKLEKRISHGVCVCCNRTFGNLARHMKTEHPEMLLPSGTRKQITGAVQ